MKSQKNIGRYRPISFIILSVLLRASSAFAGVFELGGTYAYTRSNYNAGSYTVTNSYSASLGYYFTEDSELQFSYQDTRTHNYVEKVQDINYRDRVYSMNLLYYLFEKETAIRPYFRVGLGQLNRDATGSYQGGYSPPGRLDQVSVIGGLGLKMRLGGRFGLKAEMTSYLTGGNIATWQDNITINFGGSFYF
jgi:hypothetical protein